MKAPWKFYGKVIAVRGTAVVVQDYPPKDPFSERLGGEGGEIVIETDDGTIVDYLMMGNTGSIKKDEPVTVFGTPVG